MTDDGRQAEDVHRRRSRLRRNRSSALATAVDPAEGPSGAHWAAGTSTATRPI